MNLLKISHGDKLDIEMFFDINGKWIPYSQIKLLPEDKIIENFTVMDKIGVKSRHNKKISLPVKLSKDLLYFLGVVVGDGSLPIKFNGYYQRNYKLAIWTEKYEFLKELMSLILDVFEVKPKISIKKKNSKKYYELYIYSKALFRYLNILFDIPEGKKSHIVRMPDIIRNLKPKERIPFIAGLIDTDWSIRGDGFGAHMASKKIIEDVVETLMEFGINFSEIKKVHQGKFRS